MERPFLPYGRQIIDDDDVAAVVAALQSDYLTTGPAVEAFEEALCAATGARNMVALSNGTAALHAMLGAAGVGPGDQVIVPAITFVATANAALYLGAEPVIVDVEPDTLLVDPRAVEAALTDRTRAVVAVDFAGQPCSYDALADACDGRDIGLYGDGAHSLGASFEGRPVGTLARATAFSFHPVKTITTAEGGAVATDDDELASRLQAFRNHGISQDARARETQGFYQYTMDMLGHNFRLSDLHAALGTTQLRHLPGWIQRRQELAAEYERRLAGKVEVLAQRAGRTNARHLFIVLLPEDADRDAVFQFMRGQAIGVNVHYMPLHEHAYYQAQGISPPHGAPHAEAASRRILTLPLHPAMMVGDVERVCQALLEAIET